MTKEQFLEFHTGYYGEEVDNIKQIVLTTFSGEELYEYALALLKFKSELQEVVSAVEKDKIEDELPTKEQIIKKLYQLAQIGQTHDGVMMTRIFEKEAEMILELFS